jgi:hypothetical protein
MSTKEVPISMSTKYFALWTLKSGIVGSEAGASDFFDLFFGTFLFKKNMETNRCDGIK